MAIDDYDDIIDLEYHKSTKYPHMTPLERAGQFASFAALTGLDDKIKEVGRITEKKVGLTDDQVMYINDKLTYLAEHLKDHLVITVDYFKPDAKKKGGINLEYTGILKNIDNLKKELKFMDNTIIKINRITNIDFN